VLIILQFANGMVGYVEETNAGNAIAALKERLAPECHVCRNGQWNKMPSRELVPGDLIELKLGDIVPADAILLEGQPVQVDQAALTGESLPVTIHPDGKVKQGSAVKRGEIKAVVCATGKYTFFGKAADMINSVEAVGRFQKIVFGITMWLLAASIVLTIVIFIKLMVTSDKPTINPMPKRLPSKFISAISNCIVILVASIPIAIEIVCTSTLAVGSRRLAESKVIVARLSAIEELAGMTILCSDKTGTLTQNKLSLNDPILIGDITAKDLIFHAALASKRDGGQDAIDFCICQALPADDKARLSAFRELEFIPFNPTDKRTEATVEVIHDRSVFRVSKGAPQILLNMSHNADELRPRVQAAVQELADRGFRSLGVGVSYTGVDEPTRWEFQGVLSVFDPPRIDTKATIEAAYANGV